MWLVNFLPEWVFTALVIIGALGFIASFLANFIPIISRYVIPLQVIFVLVLTTGVYLSGASHCNNSWAEKAKELETQVRIAEEKAKVINTKIEHVYVDRVQKVKDVQVVVQERIREVTVNVDEKCKVSPEVIEILNAAARNIKPGEVK